MPDRNNPLVLVSNRGPVTFDEDGSMSRGTGGLVTALTGLASYPAATWISSAMTQGGPAGAREAGEGPFTVSLPGEQEGEYQVRLVVSDEFAYDRFYNIVA